MTAPTLRATDQVRGPHAGRARLEEDCGPASAVASYLDAVFGESDGRAHLAVGSGQRLEDGKLRFRSWVQSSFAWPAERDLLARNVAQEAAAGADVYLCPYLMAGSGRAKGAAVERRKVHADVDGQLDLDRVDRLSGYAVASGSAGHGHVYVDLDRPVPAAHHEALCRALGRYLGDADAKISDNDLLRPPGTWNHKAAPPRAVAWRRKPTGIAWDPELLAQALGVALPSPDLPQALSTPMAAAEPVDLDTLPARVRDALALVSGDRSTDTMRVVGACHDTGLTLAQTRGVVADRADLAERLASRHDDDVLRCWLKATDSRAERTRARNDEADSLQALDGAPAAAPSPAPGTVAGTVPGAAADEDAAARTRRLFPRIDWHQLWADDTEEEWIHHPLLPARRSVVIYSPPKVGKSLVALEMAVAVSRGDMFLGYAIGARHRVLYVDFENDPRGDVRSRLQAMGYTPDDLDHLDYLSFPRLAGLDTERGSLELLEAVRVYGSQVVVIDTVSRAVDGEENSNDTWLGLYRHTLVKLKSAGIAVLRLDHTGKDETKGQRGGSAKSGDVDAIWRLTRITEERFRLECTDSRLQISTKSLHLRRHQLPRLHHTVEVLGAVSDHDAKVAHLVELCNANGLAVEANRDAVRTFAATRGIKVSGRVVQDVIRTRKGELQREFTSARDG
ncbi:hypothetical protein GCM10009817_30840 [Terrabacter lapilli]|uniref:AAA+ ATPase domain-containing protein n=1 Tax=Terrabacter lapilli TaxID=436231 RepID=A0ABN2SIC5_9MICO